MKLLKKVSAFLIKKDGNKDVLDKKRIMILLITLMSIGSFSVLFFKQKDDSSSMTQSSTPIEQDVETNKKASPSNNVFSAMFNNSTKRSGKQTRSGKKKKPPSRPIKNIKYQATQVIERKDANRLDDGLSIGTNLIGKLLTTIDTRESAQLYKVLLPYGGKSKNGASIPKNTIIFGKISYQEKGTKVFIEFSKGLLPDGREVKLKAQALSSKNYSPGVNGDYHGKQTERIAAALGLSMVSAMTNTLTEREALGTGAGPTGGAASEVTIKANTKNALYQGLSKVSDMEASRQASELGGLPEYVTIPAGRELIINLLSTYYGEL
jgi:type IV secretory pathway VirB10-like protein